MTDRGRLVVYRDLMFTLCVFFIYAGSPAPAVNESHYLTKAKHAWDASFGAGDLFLESADAHWFFFLTFGWLTQYFSLATTAWIGRFVSWLCLAIAWRRLSQHFWPGPFVAVATAAGLVTVLHFGHLSGEWVFGGFEAKCLTYACVFAALAEIVSNRWDRGWWWLGLGSAYHVVTGGWVVLSVMAAYVSIRAHAALRNKSTDVQPIWHQWQSLCAGGLLSLLGLIPALWLNHGATAAEQRQAAAIYVYTRLPHHLSFTHFSSERMASFIALIAIIVIMSVFYRRQIRRCLENRSQAANHGWIEAESIKLQRLWYIAFAAGVIAAIGAVIDYVWGVSDPELAATLLRYYWFRWNDVIWPIVLVLTITSMVRILWAHGHESALHRSQAQLAAVLIAASLIPVTGFLGYRFWASMTTELPPADQQTLIIRTEPRVDHLLTLEHWRAACEWVRTHTDKADLFLTPRYQQTFKWYAQRPEVVCWKDSPQDAKGLLEWNDRVQETFRYEDGYLQAFNDDDVARLKAKYPQLRYVIVDRRVIGPPLRLPLVYPLNEEDNETFWIYRVLE